MSVAAITSSVATHTLGKFSDFPNKRYPIAIASALSGFIGCLALTSATNYFTFMIIFGSLLAVAAGLFSQLMGIAFTCDRNSTSFTRAVASCGWVVGAPFGGFIVAWWSTVALFYMMSATYALLGIAIYLISLHRAETRPIHEVIGAKPFPGKISPARGSIIVTLLVLALIHTLIALFALAMPWRIIQIGGTGSHVGIAFSVAAAVEIPFIAGSNYLRKQFGPANIVFIASAILTIYNCIAFLCSNIFSVIVLCSLNGIATGMMMGLSLILIQERMNNRPGYASSIYSNMLRLSYVAALLASGQIAQSISVGAIFLVAGVAALCLSASLIISQPLGAISLRTRSYGSRATD